jgi:pyruvate kinase
VADIEASTEAGAGAGVEAHHTGRAAPTGKDTDVPGSSSEAVCFAACQLAGRLDARAIIAAVQTKTEAMHLARFRPQVPLVMTASSLRLYRSLALIHGVAPLLLARDSPEPQAPQAPVSQAREWLFAHGLAQPGDRAVLLYASNVRGGEPDSLRIVRL